MGNRPHLNSFTPEQRSRLVALMLSYLTDSVVADHLKIIHFGEKHFTGHRDYVAKLEEYLLREGATEFVPLPQWDPAKPVPPEFNVVKARDAGTPRPPLVNLNPGLPLPERFVLPTLCEFRDADTLANEVNPWHVHVHTAIGGSMGHFPSTAAAPIFWCFHAYVGEIYEEWLRHCQGEGTKDN
ncbi:MAG: tyrosinase family protein [Thermoleophilia bacterium]|nr:tyrosinase family protein [Thermoleophilia bacterium]